MEEKLTQEQKEFLNQKRQDCGVEFHVGIPCIEINGEYLKEQEARSEDYYDRCREEDALANGFA